MPAAAVIPALIAYDKIVAVKKLVVGFWDLYSWSGESRALTVGFFCLETALGFKTQAGSRTFTLNKLECLKQAYALNTLAWNKQIGLWFYVVGLRTEVMINRDSWGH